MSKDEVHLKKVREELEILENLVKSPGFARFMAMIDGHHQKALKTVTGSADPNSVMRAAGILSITEELKAFAPRNLQAYRMQLEQEKENGQ